MATTRSRGTNKQQVDKTLASAQEIDYTDILRVISGWPLPTRIALMQDVLKTLTEEKDATERRSALAKLQGFLKTDQSPPSDDQVKQWLEERRMAKYS